MATLALKKSILVLAAVLAALLAALALTFLSSGLKFGAYHIIPAPFKHYAVRTTTDYTLKPEQCGYLDAGSPENYWPNGGWPIPYQFKASGCPENWSGWLPLAFAFDVVAFALLIGAPPFLAWLVRRNYRRWLHNRVAVIVLVGIVLVVAVGIWRYQRSFVYLIPYRNNTGCPAGLEDYGVPLGCVSHSTIEDCKTQECPVCLASSTTIAAANGQKPVTDLRQGDLIYTIDAGKKVLRPVIKLGHVGVPPLTSIYHLELSDGRALYVSPKHPLATGQYVYQLKAGDILDGATVLSKQLVPYSGKTYDILPAGSTGQYWANNILVGSTLIK